MGIPSGSIPDGNAQHIFPKDPMDIQDPQKSPETNPAGTNGKAIDSPLAGDSISQAIVSGEILSPEADHPKLPSPGVSELAAEFAAQESGASETDADKRKAHIEKKKQSTSSKEKAGIGGQSLKEFEQAAENSAKQIYDGFVESLPEDVGEAVAAYNKAEAEGMDEEDMQVELGDRLGTLEISLAELRFFVSYGKLISKVLALVSQMKGLISLSEQERTMEEYERESQNFKAELDIVKEEVKERAELREKIKEMERKFGASADVLLSMGLLMFLVLPMIPLAILVVTNAALMKSKGPGNDLGSTVAKMFNGGKEEEAHKGQMAGAVMTGMIAFPVGIPSSVLMGIDAAKDKRHFDMKNNSPRDASDEYIAYMNQINIRLLQINRAMQVMLSEEEDLAELVAMINQLLAMLYQVLVVLRQEGQNAMAMVGTGGAGGAGGTNPATLVGIVGGDGAKGEDEDTEGVAGSSEDSALAIYAEAEKVAVLPQQKILDALDERLASLEEFVQLLQANPDLAPQYKDVLLEEVKNYLGVLTGAVNSFISTRKEEGAPDMDKKLLNNIVQFFYTVMPEWPQSPEKLIEIMLAILSENDEGTVGVMQIALEAGQSAGYLEDPSGKNTHSPRGNPHIGA